MKAVKIRARGGREGGREWLTSPRRSTRPSSPKSSWSTSGGGSALCKIGESASSAADGRERMFASEATDPNDHRRRLSPRASDPPTPPHTHTLDSFSESLRLTLRHRLRPLRARLHPVSPSETTLQPSIPRGIDHPLPSSASPSTRTLVR